MATVHGQLVLARLVSNHAEEVNRIGMIRLDREDLPVDRLGSLHSPALVVLDRNRKCFRNRHHSFDLVTGIITSRR